MSFMENVMGKSKSNIINQLDNIMDMTTKSITKADKSDIVEETVNQTIHKWNGNENLEQYLTKFEEQCSQMEID